MGGSSGVRLYGGKTADRRRDERRARLMDAALESFGTVGYFGTAIEDLCAQAKIATRSFYELFPSKEDLLLAVYDDLLDEVSVAVVEALAAAPAESEASARAGLTAFVHSMLADERKGQIGIVGLIGVSARCEARRREALRSFAAIIGHQRARVGGRPLDEDELHVLSMALVGATVEVLIDWLSDRRTPIEVVIEQLVRLYDASTANL